jgi:hypothetical protein
VRTIDAIREKVRAREYEFAVPHFFEEMANDDLIFADIEAAICRRSHPSAVHARPARHALRGRWDGD